MSAAASKADSGLASLLAKLGIRGQRDLVLHLPLRYEDETKLTPLAKARSGEPVLVEAEVVESKVEYRGRRTLVVKLSDGERELWVRFMHFYPSQQKQFKEGKRVRLFGEVRPGMFGDEMVHPRYRIVAPGAPLSKSLTPVYPTTAGLPQHQLRERINGALDTADLSDTLDPKLVAKLKLMPFREAVLFLHRPPPDVSAQKLDDRTHPAWRRLKFDEILAQQLAMRIAYRERRAKTAPPLPETHTLTNALVKSLPFPLTRAQRTAHAAIGKDLAHAHPMRRLLQGDVGSGKTLVAAMAALQAIENGWQAALMAPTEILAEQHYLKLSHWLVPLGVKIAWLAGALKGREKKKTVEAIAAGDIQFAIGTHALFQEGVEFAKLGLAIVDEQHRFGVEQRLALSLRGQAGVEPHQLMMSATPIPRTLSMTYYADLDVTVIDELPPGRTPVVTKLVAEERRDDVIRRVRDAVRDGEQAYWVCPLIEESEQLQLQTAIETFETMKETFPDLAVGLVHG